MKKCFVAGNYYDKFTASSKAKIDAEEIVEINGFRNCGLHQSYLKPSSFKAYLKYGLTLAKLYLSIPRNGIVFMQHPKQLNLKVINIAKRRKNKVIILVHDLNSLRNWSDTGERELLNAADLLIVPTEAMKAWLISNRIGRQYVVLGIFDYLHGSKTSAIENATYRIAFAGNLGKSDFIDKVHLRNSVLNLYGIGSDKRILNSGVIFKGCYPPDKLAENMEADFGLVWDGDSTESCTGQLGEYLRLIAPHKLSMYISAGIPVIVWEESAMAPFVKEHNVGITVNSLNEMEDILNRMDRAQYLEIKKNINAVAEKLSSGYFLSKALKEAEAILI